MVSNVMASQRADDSIFYIDDEITQQPKPQQQQKKSPPSLNYASPPPPPSSLSADAFPTSSTVSGLRLHREAFGSVRAEQGAGDGVRVWSDRLWKNVHYGWHSGVLATCARRLFIGNPSRRHGRPVCVGGEIGVGGGGLDIMHRKIGEHSFRLSGWVVRAFSCFVLWWSVFEGFVKRERRALPPQGTRYLFPLVRMWRCYRNLSLRLSTVSHTRYLSVDSGVHLHEYTRSTPRLSTSVPCVSTISEKCHQRPV